MSRTLILTTAIGYKPEQVAILWRSLQKTGFAGRLVMLVDSESADALEPHAPPFVQLLIYGRYTPDQLLAAAPQAIQSLAQTGMALDSADFMTQAAAIDRIWTNHFFSSFNHPSVFRYLFYHDYLRDNVKGFDAVLLCDCRDVLFQANPDTILTGAAPLTFGVECARNVLGAEAFNTAWVKHLWGDAVFDQYQGRRICCSGVTTGGVDVIRAYLDLLCGDMLQLAAQTKAGYGFDQAIHNRLWWDDRLPHLVISENFTSAVANVQGEDEAIMLGLVRNGKLCRRDTLQPIMLVHQYDRYPDLTEALLKTL